MAALAVLLLPAVDVLWEDLRLGDMPFPLEVPGHGATLDERARIKADVYAELARRRLAESGRPVPDLEGALELLARPEVAIDLVARLESDGTPPLRAVVVARGRRAVLAVQRERSIELTPVRDTAVVASIIELLPGERPGPGRSVTLPVAALKPGASSEDADPGLLRTATRGAETGAHQGKRVVESIMERPLRRVGQLGVMLRDERGKVRRLPGIAWFDTDQGRYATSVTRGRDGADWTTLTPTDNARLTHRVAEDLGAARSR